MSYTETQLITHAYRKGLLGDDETPTAEQLDKAQKIYRSRLAGLSVRGFKFWNLTAAAIPEELLDPLATYLNLFLLSDNGGPQPTDDQVLASEHTLRQLCAIEPTGNVIEATYF